ncbi:MAG: VOC family protein [Actinomycetota bacterium]
MEVIFAVEDLSRALNFYERAFGWPKNQQIDPDGNVVAVAQTSQA